MLLRLLRSSSFALATLALLGACSSDSNGPPTGDGNGNNAGGSDGGGNGTGGASLAIGGTNLQQPDNTAGAGSEESCAAAEANAELTPIYMVFMYDTSGSMGDQQWFDAEGNLINEQYNREQRWEPVKEGMIAFFNDPGSTNLYASLEYFPATGNLQATCSANYASPAVPLTPLNTAQSLIDSLNRKEPAGGTPTLPALRGAVEYARELKQREPNAHVVVVLVTDGEPAMYEGEQVVEECPAGDSLLNTVDGVAAIARAAYQGNPSIEVHVIGVGDSVDALDAIATAGGTNLVLISATDPAATSAQLKDTLKAIQVAKFSCDMEIPAPTGLDDVDYNLVNVDFVHGDASVEPFSKNVGCSGGTGWQYDDDENPTMIQICPSTCNTLQLDPAGQLSVQFGCQTRIY